MPKPEEGKPSRPPQRPLDRPARLAAAPTPVVVRTGVPHGATESGWLPDCVYTGEKFETGLAFFADALGRITRFSREPADLASARRLEGQAALPGLVNAHSHSFQRLLRGRSEQDMPHVIARLSEEDVFDTARLAFLEMLLAGITCVGEFHFLRQRPDGSAWADPNLLAREVARAAHEVGLRIALLNVAYVRPEIGSPGAASARFKVAAIDAFLRDTEQLRTEIEKEFPADEVWLGTGAHSLGAVPLDAIRAVAGYARTHRLRFHVHASHATTENAACVSEYGRAPIALLAEQGVIDKRFTAVGAIAVSDDEIKALGAARAMVCTCPGSDFAQGLGGAPVDKLIAAGAGVGFGTDSHQTVDVLKDARLLELHLRASRGARSGIAADPATALFHAATVTGARSLGATSGALEVGRPADFFTVNLYDPSIVGADPTTLLANVVFALERRAIREVWVGARQRIANGRHIAHGAIVGRFVDARRRLWGS
jgi:formimidoylglutamate deiminase